MGRTLGDNLDIALGGPEHFVSHHCKVSHHRACLGYYAGRTCECECHDDPGTPDGTDFRGPNHKDVG